MTGFSCDTGGALIGAVPGKLGRIGAGAIWSEPEPAGEAPKAEAEAVGDAEWDDGVGRFLGEATDEAE